MGIITLLVFWGAIVKVWMADGPRIPIMFILLWLAGFFGMPSLDVSGNLFMSMEALLAVILLIIGQYKSS
jgi:hypothetical protein